MDPAPLPDQVLVRLHRLAERQIELLPLVDLPRYLVFERRGYAALVERTEEGFGKVGTAGRLFPQGIAPLVWRGERAVFLIKGVEHAASPEQVEELRQFQRDLQEALR